MATMFKFRIELLKNIEAESGIEQVQHAVREEIDLLVSAAQKLELP